jgi:hypothetical protein
MNKQQSTQAGWVSSAPPVTIEQQPAQRAPTFKGETSGLRLLVIFAVSALFAIAIAIVIWLLSQNAVWAFAVFAVLFMPMFVWLYRYDAEVSTGLRHHRMQLIADDNKAWAAVELAKAATSVNTEQAAQIEIMQEDIRYLQDSVDALRTVTITDREGARAVPVRDDIDMMIDGWLSQSVFAPNGTMVGVHESGVLKVAYPFKARDEKSQQAHVRLVRAGLVTLRKPGNQYAWCGPMTLSETRRKLQPARGQGNA